MIANLRELLRRGGSRRFSASAADRPRSLRRKMSLELLEERQLLAGGLVVTGPFNVTQLAGNQSEPTIALNPLDTKNLVAFANNNDANPEALVASYSNDGGKTWTVNGLFANGSDALPHACCDASASFDQFGNLFMVYLTRDGRAPLVMSTDGGKSYTLVTTISSAADQPKLAIGPGGSKAAESLWIEYADNSGKIGGVGMAVTGLGTVGAPTVAQLVPGSDGGNFGKPAIGPKGEVMFSFELPSGGVGPATLYTALDPDGLDTALGFAAAVKLTDVNVGGFAPIPAQPARTIDSEVCLAYDYSGGTHDGRLYAVFTDSPAVNNADTNIFLMYSDDDGKTWSARTRVNDDTTTNSQFFPRVAVDQYSGNVGVSFQDCRNDKGSGSDDLDGIANTDAEFFATVSTDGGQSFLTNVQVSNGPSNAEKSGNGGNNGNDYGDYTGLAFAHNILYPIWTDNSSTLGGNPDRPNLEIATAQVSVATLTVTAKPISPTELTQFNGVVATFKPASAGIPTTSFTAQIAWGDGTLSAGTITNVGGGYQVNGNHTYGIGGTYATVVTVTQLGGTTATGTGVATVVGLPINATGTTLTLKEGDSFSGILAHFVDTAPVVRPAGFYSSTISFGDGVNGTGTVVASPTGGFDILDPTGHVYGGGTYTVIISITKPGLTVTTQSSALVTDSPLTAAGLNFHPLEGQNYKGALATFTDADPRVPGVTNYFATIDWGDGSSPTAGRIAPNPVGPGFIVQGDHPYNVGSFTVVVTIGNFSGGSTAVAVSSADVQDAPLTSQGFDMAQTAGVTFNSIVAGFSDSDPRLNPSSQYAAMIDWGDGTTQPGQVVVNEDGGYLVKGIHAYRPGSFQISTTITDNAGATTVATSTATVPDSPVTLVLSTKVVLPEGVAQDAIIGTITTPDRLALPTDFTASVDFGDGTTGLARIVANPATPTSITSTFSIVINKAYDLSGSYPIGVIVTSPGGTQVQTGTTLTVTAAPITTTSLPINGISKTSMTAIPVASFTTPNPHAKASTYSATINWGDGQTTAGTVAANGLGAFLVTGDHLYAEGGSFAVAVTLTGSGRIVGVVNDTATIGDLLTPITGGVASTPGGAITSSGLTNVSQPTITGQAEPFANVQVFTTASNGTSPVLVGTGKADGTGHYAIVSTPLADGVYTVMASATDRFGKPSSNMTVLYPTPSRGRLTVDTQGPKVTGAQFNPKTGKVTIQFSDNLSGLSAGVLNAANFSLASSNGQAFQVTGLVVSPVSPNTNQTATLTFNTPKVLKKGSYVLTINAQGAGDQAGNVLDERYFVPFPGLYNRAGQNFIASFKTDGRTVSQPTQFIPPNEIVAAKKHGLFVRKHFRR
ncbi:MAG: hypothetical protein JWN86_3739 [Planctomycetota bacterium]|nr:hypothetical protein [Planctomycetota bacterium]